MAIGSRADLANLAKVVLVLGCEQVFEKEEAVLFNFFGKPNPVDRRDAFVDVVQHLEVPTNLAAKVVEQAEGRVHVGLRLEDAPAP